MTMPSGSQTTTDYDIDEDENVLDQSSFEDELDDMVGAETPQDTNDDNFYADATAEDQPFDGEDYPEETSSYTEQQITEASGQVPLEFLVTPLEEAKERARSLGLPVIGEVESEDYDEDEEEAEEAFTSSRRRMKTSRRTRSSSTKSRKLDPSQMSDAQRKAHLKAKLLLHGISAFILLICVAAGTYKIPQHMDMDPIWPWSVIFPEEKNNTQQDNIYERTQNKVDRQELQNISADLERALEMWNDGEDESKAVDICKNSLQTVNEIIQSIENDHKEGKRDGSRVLIYAKSLQKRAKSNIEDWANE